MNELTLDKYNISKLFPLFIIIGVLLNSGYILNTTEYAFISTIFSIFMLLSFLVIKLFEGKVKLRIDKALLYFILLTLPIFMSLIMHLNTYNLYYSIKLIFIILISYFIYKMINFEIFITNYNKLMMVLTIIALVVTLASLITNFDFLPTIVNRNNVNYINGYVFYLILGGLSGLPRATSIFWEPGIFATFLIFSLILESFFKQKKKSYLNIVVFSIGILATQSSAGYLLYSLYLIMVIESYKLRSLLKVLLNTTLLSVTCLFIVAWDNIKSFLLNVNYDIFSKIFFENLQTTNTRLYSPLLNLDIFYSSPIFGKGFSQAELDYNFLKLNYDINMKVDAQTSTPTQLLAALGIFGAIYTLLWIISIMKLNNLSNLNKFYLLLIVMIILNKEPHILMLFTYCLLLYLYNHNKFHGSEFYEERNNSRNQQLK